MKDKELEDKLRSHFLEMVNRYRKLRVRFEYSESRGVYLVSYYSDEEYDMNDCFFDDLMAFGDKMDYLYGDEAPLFCFEEKNFRLSDDAEVIESVQYDEQFSLVPSSAGLPKWEEPIWWQPQIIMIPDNKISIAA